MHMIRPSKLRLGYTECLRSYPKSPLLSVTRKGRSLDKTPIALVSSLIPTLPVELLQVSNYQRYLVYQLSYLLKR